MDDVLHIQGLEKRFGPVTANDGVDLRVRPGEVVGLLGHNGAGKTTLVSQVVGLLRPDAGRIRVAGIDAVAQPAQARRRVALQPQGQAPIDGLTPRVAIELAGRVRGLSRRDARAGAERMAEALQLGPWMDRRATAEGGLSGGVRRLTTFAMAVVAPTPLVVLDEPTNDVDAARRRLLWDAVRAVGREGAGVLLVTHNVVEAERVLDRVVLLDEGRVIGTGTPAQLQGDADGLRLELTLEEGAADPTAGGDGTAAADAAPVQVGSPVPVSVGHRVVAGRRVLLGVARRDAAQAVAWAAELRDRRQVERFALVPAGLEDAYLARIDAARTSAAPTSDTPVEHLA